jgi:Tol biopolymer transport system component
MTFRCLDSVGARGPLLCFLLSACGSGVVDVGELPEDGSAGTANDPIFGPDTDPLGAGCAMEGLAQYRLIFDSDAGGLERRIYSMRADGTELEALTPPGELAREPALSPDGNRLAYSTPEGIKLLDMISGQAELIVPRGDQPSWSPDGSRLAFRIRGNALFLRAMDAGSNNDGQSDIGFYCTECEAPELTPDGTGMVYVDTRPFEGAEFQSRIGLFNLGPELSSGHDIIGNATVPMSHPTVSGDGVWVAAALECDDSASLWVTPYGFTTPACEGRRTTTTDGPSAHNPNWGPGVFIAYERGEPPRDIAIVAADTGEACHIEGPGDDRNPSWGTLPVSVPE